MAGMDTSGLDLGEDGLRRSSRKRAELEADAEGDVTGRLPALSRMSTPEADDAIDSLAVSSTNPLAVFDVRAAEDSAAGEEAASQLRASEDAEASTGWAKSTVRALRVVRSQLADNDDESRFVDVDEETREEAAFRLRRSRRTPRVERAAGFFFEMLVLGTKDCVRLQQDEAYGDIKVRARRGCGIASAPATQTQSAPVAA